MAEVKAGLQCRGLGFRVVVGPVRFAFARVSHKASKRVLYKGVVQGLARGFYGVLCRSCKGVAKLLPVL